MSKKEASKHAGATANEVEEKPVPQEDPKTQDKSPQEDDEQESRIPLEEMSSRQIGEKGEEIAAKYLIKEDTKLSKLTGRVRLVRLILLLKMAITLCLLR